MSYIVTESNPRLGFQGLVVDRKEYIEAPYFDRALFEALDDLLEQWYYCKLEVTIRDKVSHYLLMDDKGIERILGELGLSDYAGFVIKEISKNCNASLKLGEYRSYVFSPLK